MQQGLWFCVFYEEKRCMRSRAECAGILCALFCLRMQQRPSIVDSCTIKQGHAISRRIANGARVAALRRFHASHQPMFSPIDPAARVGQTKYMFQGMLASHRRPIVQRHPSTSILRAVLHTLFPSSPSPSPPRSRPFLSSQSFSIPASHLGTPYPSPNFRPVLYPVEPLLPSFPSLAHSSEDATPPDCECGS